MPPKVLFEFDQPVTLTLRYAQGLETGSRYYERWPGDVRQYVFSAEEGVFYLGDSAGGLLNARLRSLAIAAGDAVTITKTRVPNHTSDRGVIEYLPRRQS